MIDRPGKRQRAFSDHVMTWGFTLFSGYHLWTTVFGMPSAYLHRPVHLLFAVALGFLMYSFTGRKRTGGTPVADVLLSLLALASFGTFVVIADKVSERLSMVDPLTAWELFAGAAGILLVLELVRRVVGWVLTAVVTAFVAYAFLGPYMPHVLAHKGFTWKQFVDYQIFGMDGIFSLAIGVSSTYIVVFIIFGTFLEMCGAGGVMMD
ncbi:MAG TPA: hypothetical protein VLT88_01470, partial [Desulfosarcina sp.]|nr:hypothetical protein [Desulfosarcina sp.]